VVIDAFRLINPQLMMLGQEPRQTTSNLGHLHKPSIQALIHAPATKGILGQCKSLAPDRTEFLKSVSKTVAEITKLQGYQLTSRAEDAKEVDAMISVLMAYFHK